MTYGVAGAATSPELTLYRTPGKASKWRAAIFTPHVIYQARVNQVFATTDSVLEITHDGGSGTLADVLPDMTLLVGSSAGAHDLGICRIRDKDVTKFYIGETSDIPWADNLYLTVIDDYSLWSRHVLIDDGVSYMDGGVAYSDQHASPDPTPIMGAHRVLKLTGSSISTQFDGSDSYVVGGMSSIASYAWSCSTASSSSGTTTSTPTFSFNAVGWHLVYLTVTAANGKSYFAVRYVYVWDAGHLPARCQIGTPSQDVESGGWQFELTMFDDCDLDAIRDHALVMLINEDYFSGSQSDIGPVAGSENIETIGWIAREEIDWNPQQGSVRFTAYTAHYWLSQIPAFPDGVEFKTGTPVAWTEFQNLTVPKGLWHFLHWRTTATRVMDVFLPDDAKYTQEVSSLASSLWEQIREMAFLQIYARAGVNAWNQLFVQVHPQLVPEDDRDFPVVMDITKNDWREEINFERLTKPECAVVALSGVAVNASGVGSSFFSLSPGHAYPHYGSIDVQDKLLVASQSQANALAGLYRGWRNNPYPEILVSLKADVRLIDCFPRSWCSLTINEADTPRGISFSGHVIPTSVSIVTDPETGTVHREVVFEAETFQDLAVNGDIPGGESDRSNPPIPSFPPLPDFPIIIPGGVGDGTPGGPPSVLFHDSAGGFIVASDFNGTPVYSAVNAGLTPTQCQEANWMDVCPNGAVYVGKLGETGSFIARAPTIGGTFVVLSTTDYIKTAAINPLASEQVAFITRVPAASTATFHVGTLLSYSSGLTLTNNNFWGSRSLSYGLGAWLLTSYDLYYKINTGGTAVLATSSPTPHVTPDHLRASTTGITYHETNGTDALIKGENNLATSSTVSTGQSVVLTSVSSGISYIRAGCDPTGQYIMTAALVGGKGKSSDYGATWATLGSLPVGSHWCFAYAGPGRFIAANAVVRYSPDFGATWENKENSSLTSIVPFPNINMLKVLGF